MFHPPGFFDGPCGPGPFHKGDLKYIILDLIKDKPRYGYEIIKALKEKSHGLYKPSPGAVYPTLQMLEEMGYVTAKEQDGKRVYTITDEGRGFLEEREDSAGEIRDHMKDCWDRGRMSEIGVLMGEVARFATLLGPRLHSTEPEKIQRIRKVMSNAYDEIEEILRK